MVLIVSAGKGGSKEGSSITYPAKFNSVITS
nr:hypothetical protein [Bacillus thuringiensis]